MCLRFWLEVEYLPPIVILSNHQSHFEWCNLYLYFNLYFYRASELSQIQKQIDVATNDPPWGSKWKFETGWRNIMPPTKKHRYPPKMKFFLASGKGGRATWQPIEDFFPVALCLPDSNLVQNLLSDLMDTSATSITLADYIGPSQRCSQWTPSRKRGVKLSVQSRPHPNVGQSGSVDVDRR